MVFSIPLNGFFHEALLNFALDITKTIALAYCQILFLIIYLYYYIAEKFGQLINLFCIKLLEFFMHNKVKCKLK